MELPKVAIVGRPNVGKSTLFNRLIGRRQAIVDDIPGVTRDRQYGPCDWEGRYFTVIDTGGFIPGSAGAKGIEHAVRDQAMVAMLEADAIILVVDGRFGLAPADSEMADVLRKQKKPVLLAVNKIDSEKEEPLLAEFHRLGIKKIFPVSSETSRGISDLLDGLLKEFPAPTEDELRKVDLKMAIIGRPNVGKSTLLNAILGEDRAVVNEVAGTTRDPLNITLERGTRLYEIVDTAGVRRKGKTVEKLEKISVLKTFHAIDKAHLALLLIDAEEGVTAQDLTVLGEASDHGKAVILVLNKWDLVAKDRSLKEYQKRFESTYKRHAYIPMIALSAKTGRGVGNLFKLIDEVQENYQRRVGTGELNRVFQKAIGNHPHPVVSGQTINLSYMTQSGWSPPTFVVFANKPKMVTENYRRYLEGAIRKAFNFEGAPLRWILRQKK